MKLSDAELASSTLHPDTLTEAVQQVRINGYVLFESVLPAAFVAELHSAFMALFNAYIASSSTNRGTNRYQMHLPFQAPFNDPRIITSPFILPLLDALLGKDYVCPYFASDTPLPGSDYQRVHSDIFNPFPESAGLILPPYCLVLNIPLVDFRADNGPLEIWPGGTHHQTPTSDTMQTLAEQMPHLPLLMPAGSLVLRDARMWHRGTPNRADAPRPNMALIYAYPWVDTHYPRVPVDAQVYASLGERVRHIFRLENIGGA